MNLHKFFFLSLLLGSSFPLTAQWVDDGGNRIRTNQRVAIVSASAADGSWHPNSDYRLSIDGNFATDELRVELDSDWPDYVFSEDYELLALPQVRAFIEANGHLPGLPSITEVAKQELGLGEAHRLLTEKVEELTLYLIQSHERKLALLAEIERLEALLEEH